MKDGREEGHADCKESGSVFRGEGEKRSTNRRAKCRNARRESDSPPLASAPSSIGSACSVSVCWNEIEGEERGCLKRVRVGRGR
jgi:hypothetical protein